METNDALLRLAEVIGVCLEKATPKTTLLDSSWSDVDLSGYNVDDAVELGISTGETKLARRILDILGTKYDIVEE